MKLLIVLTLCILSASAQWPHLRATWSPLPSLGGFNDLPRTADEITAEGWVQLSACSDGNENFPGDRYARTPGDNDIVVIFDGNGFIAGVQTIVPFEKTEDDLYFPYSQNPWYQLGDFFGQQGYYTTAYFVDPSIICNGGRNQQQFEEQGTGDRLLFQNGPTPSDVMNIPLTQEEIIAEDNVWYEHSCFLNMGVHFFNYNYDPAQDCDETIPFQVVYDLDGNLNGLVFQHIGLLDSGRFEAPNDFAIDSIIVSAPTCVYDLVAAPGISTLHVYVGEYRINCGS